METVQKLVPYFQELLQQWYELTLHNQEYAICLAVSVWLITAIFYSIRIGFLKRSNAKLLKDKTATQTSLDETKKELQTLQQQYTEANERMEQAVEKSAAESQRLQASNKQLANSLSSMVDCFELNQHNLPTAESENLLTEYEAVVARALERFQTEQQAKTQLQLSFHAETAKLAEKEMLVSSLQNRLDTQTQQLAKLELAIEHYEDAQRQLEADKQQLAKDMQNRQDGVAQALALEKQNIAAIHSQAQAVLVDNYSETVTNPDISEKAVEIIHPEPESVKTELQPPAPISPVSETSTKQPVENKSQPDSGNKMKGLFGKAMDKIAKMDEKMGSSGKVDAESDQSEVAAVQSVAEPVTKVESIEFAEADKAKSSQRQGLNEKLSGMFSGFKKSADKQSKPVKTETVSVTLDESELKPAATEKDNKVTSKLSGLFGKLKSKK
jgi:myosin heavy subunit